MCEEGIIPMFPVAPEGSGTDRVVVGLDSREPGTVVVR